MPQTRLSILLALILLLTSVHSAMGMLKRTISDAPPPATSPVAAAARRGSTGQPAPHIGQPRKSSQAKSAHRSIGPGSWLSQSLRRLGRRGSGSPNSPAIALFGDRNPFDELRRMPTDNRMLALRDTAQMRTLDDALDSRFRGLSPEAQTVLIQDIGGDLATLPEDTLLANLQRANTPQFQGIARERVRARFQDQLRLADDSLVLTAFEALDPTQQDRLLRLAHDERAIFALEDAARVHGDELARNLVAAADLLEAQASLTPEQMRVYQSIDRIESSASFTGNRRRSTDGKLYAQLAQHGSIQDAITQLRSGGGLLPEHQMALARVSQNTGLLGHFGETDSALVTQISTHPAVQEVVEKVSKYEELFTKFDLGSPLIDDLTLVE